MKKLFSAFLVIALLSSCSTVKKTSTSITLSPKVEQIPTLYELDVNETSVRRDTVWRSGMFSRDRSSLNDVMSALTASIVDSQGADVLVEPKTTVKTTGSSFNKVYNISISGYPAKYSNFHTATPEEYDMLYGPRVNFDNVSLLVNTGQAPSKSTAPISKVRKAKVSSAKDNSLDYERRHGFRFGVSYLMDFSIEQSFFNYGGTISLGCQLNNKLYVGGVVDLATYQYEYYYPYYDPYWGYEVANVEKVTSFRMTMSAEVKYYFLNKQISPFVDLQAGLSLINFYPADFTMPSVGVAFKNIELSLGCAFIGSIPDFMPSLRLGYMF